MEGANAGSFVFDVCLFVFFLVTSSCAATMATVNQSKIRSRNVAEDGQPQLTYPHPARWRHERLQRAGGVG